MEVLFPFRKMLFQFQRTLEVSRCAARRSAHPNRFSAGAANTRLTETELQQRIAISPLFELETTYNFEIITGL